MIRVQTVALAPSETASNTNTRALATALFAADDDPDTLRVEVVEHGGWWEMFAWSDNLKETILLGTASRRSRNTEAERIVERDYPAEFNYLPLIVRESASCVTA